MTLSVPCAYLCINMARRYTEAPGVTRLRALDMRPRLPVAKSIIAAIVAVPKPQKPRRRQKIAPEQGALL